MFLFGGIFLYTAFLLNAGPDVGWFSYPPLAESLYAPAKRPDILYEFKALNVMWHTDAYGSIVWLLLGMHTVHMLTDVADTLVLAALMFIGPIEEKRFVDVEENSVYWYFVAAAWLPIYGVIYWAPRLI
jgi:Cytochrome c oxidase subunit III